MSTQNVSLSSKESIYHCLTFKQGVIVEIKYCHYDSYSIFLKCVYWKLKKVQKREKNY